MTKQNIKDVNDIKNSNDLNGDIHAFIQGVIGY